MSTDRNVPRTMLPFQKSVKVKDDPAFRNFAPDVVRVEEVVTPADVDPKESVPAPVPVTEIPEKRASLAAYLEQQKKTENG